MTQAELSQLTGISLPAINRIEAGKRWPRAENVRFLAKALKMKEADLFRDDDGPLPPDRPPPIPKKDVVQALTVIARALGLDETKPVQRKLDGG